MKSGALKWIVPLVVLLLIAGVFFFQKERKLRDLSDILNEGRVVALIETGEYGFTRDSSKVRGFQYEIIRRYADYLGVELMLIHSDNIGNAFSGLNNGNFDVLVSLRPVSTDTTGFVSSLVPVLSTRLMLVQKKDSAAKLQVQYQYQLDSQTLHVQRATPFIHRLKLLAGEVAADIDIIETDSESLDMLISKVYEGTISFTICPEYLAAKFISKYPAIDISVPLSFREDLSWMVHAESVELKKSLNSFLAEFVGSPDFLKLYQQYFLQN
jgi:membrane-bound lytic murein transglycosylase F